MRVLRHVGGLPWTISWLMITAGFAAWDIIRNDWSMALFQAVMFGYWVGAYVTTRMERKRSAMLMFEVEMWRDEFYKLRPPMGPDAWVGFRVTRPKGGKS